MPVEIKELVIKAVIKDNDNGGNPDNSESRLVPPEHQAIIEACVKQVLKILERKQGR